MMRLNPGSALRGGRRKDRDTSGRTGGGLRRPAGSRRRSINKRDERPTDVFSGGAGGKKRDPRQPSERGPGPTRADVQLPASRLEGGGKKEIQQEGTRIQRGAPGNRSHRLSSPRTSLFAGRPASATSVDHRRGGFKAPRAAGNRCRRVRTELPSWVAAVSSSSLDSGFR